MEKTNKILLQILTELKKITPQDKKTCCDLAREFEQTHCPDCGSDLE